MRAYPRLLPAALALSATLPSFAQLSGTYTVGPAGNYATLAAAITALQTNGVSGPVNMDIISGTYSGNWTINAIPGTSAVNTVTFRSQALDSTAVTLSNIGASAVLTLNNCTFVRLSLLTVTGTNSGVILNNAASDITVSHCRFAMAGPYAGVNCGATFTGLRIEILGNAVTSGAFAFRLMNAIPSFGADMLVRGNVITGVTTDGIIVERADGLTIEDNTITSAGATTATYDNGIFVRYCINELSIVSNTVNWGIGTNCIYLNQHSALPAQPPVIANNMLLLSGGNVAGSVISVSNSNGTRLLHNSLRSTVARHALQVQFCTNVDVQGNIMVTTAEEVLMTQTATFTSIDHNVYYCTQANVIRWAVFTYYSWTAWQGLGWDVNSVFADPLFTSSTDLHILAGSPAIGIAPMPLVTTVDRDGDVRGVQATLLPDIGADERTDACAIGLSGTYVLGPSGAGLFPSFGTAVATLVSCGVSGPVVFEVESGIYTEQISLPSISGTSLTNTVTFRGQALDSSAAALRWPSGGANNFTVRLRGADHLAFEHLTIERSGPPGPNDVVLFDPLIPGNANRDMRFSHCRIRTATGALATGILLNKQAVTTQGCDSLKVEHTLFEGGWYGLAALINPSDRLLVQNNRFIDQYAEAIHVGGAQELFTLRGNEVTRTGAAGGNGIAVQNTHAGFVIAGNRVSGTYGNACWLFDTDTLLGGQNRLQNNMFTCVAYGLVIFGIANGLWIDHNAVMATGGTGVSVGAFATVDVVSMRNNALHGFMVPFEKNSSSVLTLSNTGHNALYSSNGAVALWNGSVLQTIPALQVASGQFANSVEADPHFYDPATGDLHAYGMDLDGGGIPLVLVPADFDGEARNTTAPDIGADEFTPALWVAPMNTCGMCDPIICNGGGNDRWIYKDRRVVARINDNGQNLGTVTMSVYVHSGAVRQSDLGQYYMNRNWNIDTQFPFLSPVSVRVFCTTAEFATYAAADPFVTTAPTAGLVHYNGVLENCLETDNPAGQQWTPLATMNGTEPRIQIPGVPRWFSGDITKDGELYLSAAGQVLPVELLAFTGRRVNDREVHLDWSTATEHDNAGFEVWRMIEGEAEFKEVGWVEGAGNSQHEVQYRYVDINTTSRVSYYRLKQVDIDGQYEWSEVVAVEGAIWADVLSVFPNPAADRATLAGLDPAGSVISLHDASGREVGRWYDTNTIDGLGELERGAYLLRATDGAGSSRSIRLVLQ